uniref:Cytochrome P450 n=1 Tax=Panagrellus redivivus TaxID=6233 RepID=A0A7E4VT77_PANRE
MGLFLVAIGLLAIYLFNFYYVQRRKLPPGPIPLPFVGNSLSFIKTPLDVCLQKWKDQYGDIMTIWVGCVPTVTLHNSRVIYDTFVKDGDAYAGRMELSWNEIVRSGPLGVMFAEGPLWREHRRFALQVFRNLGLGRNIMQERVLDDVCALISHVKSEAASGKTEVNMFDELDIAIGSVINSITFGYRFSRENRSEFKRVKKIATEAVSFFNSFLYRVMDGRINLLRRLPFFKDVYEANVNHNNESREFFLGQVDAHLKNIDLDSDEEPSDYVEAYLRMQHKLDKEGVKHTYRFVVLL